MKAVHCIIIAIGGVEAFREVEIIIGVNTIRSDISVLSLSESREENVEIERHRRLSCELGGKGLCDTSCLFHGRYHGGCCGESGPCYNVCYCNGSGYEYRCGECDL